MEHLSVWVGAGVVTAGVSAALLAGAGIAGAETGSDSGAASGSASTSSDAGKPDSTTGPKRHEPKTGPKSSSKPDSETKPDTEGDGSGAGDTAPPSDKKDEKKDDERQPATESPTEEASPHPGARSSKRDLPATGTPSKKPSPEPSVKTEKTEPPKTEKAEAIDTAQPAAESVAAEPVKPVEPATIRVAAAAVAPKSAPTTAPEVPSALSAIASLIGSVVVNVGSLAFNALQAVEALVTGPPVVPPNSTVTVRSSTIQLDNGQRVAANWYYPEGDKPPTNMILLQHGFLALGPMYSYTAANLAEQTHSIVVTPTLTSNIFAGDSFWLGGTGMSASIADLFAGDRAALTASALDAGYATRYGLDPATAKLPQKFALAGHSLGANLVSGAAGFLAENGAADDLVGVILLDGVPIGDTLPTALAKLDDYEATSGGHYIPIREIGAPPNLFNSLSNVNDALSAARPDRFNGVVLAGGVHMDSMLGGNPLIQFAAYLVAGFPQPQNPPAVDALATTWFNEWFDCHTDVGDDLVPGTTIDIPTPQGTAHGVVIGNAPATKLLRGPATVQPSAPSTLPQANPRLARLAA
jgi:hypothetical protein